MARHVRIAEAEPGPAAAEALMRQLRRRIASGEALPPERTLAAELSVKRHRLRAALLELRQEGAVAPPRIGRRRRALSAGEELIRCTNPLEVIELRLVFEPALARLAALRASPQEATRIERAATTAAGTDRGEADLAFHLAIAAGARNGLAGEIYAQLRRIGRDARLAVAAAPPCPSRLRDRDAEHRAIANAITGRDAEGAERAMRLHLLAVQRRVMERLSPGLTAA